MTDLVQIEKDYKKYKVDGIEIQAKKTPGGGWYWIILPDGSRIRHLTEVFERLSTPVEETKNGNS